MADIVNLNKARKARHRAATQQRAAENRITHGRSKAEKAAVQREQERRDFLLNSGRLETPKNRE